MNGLVIKRVLLLLFLTAVNPGVSGQKSRVVAVFQMIDQAKYDDAKEAIELAVWNEKTSRWPRTYYAKALLCQTAYEDGYKNKDIKKTNLYPDQLYVAFGSYERALELDVRERLQNSISQKYYLLSNDFRILGRDHFAKEEYEESLQAFEYALLVNTSKLVNVKVDTGLVYNTALAAFESKNWDKAIGYLTGLHEAAHAPATSLLLYQALREKGDTARSEEVLMEAVQRYAYENQVVVYLTNLLVNTDRMDLAIQVLDEAIDYRPDDYIFWWERGLIYRRMGEREKAVENLKAALELAPDNPKIYYHLGLIYYNFGIELKESALKISSNEEYQVAKEQSEVQFREAVKWLERSYEMDPLDQETISRLYQLYYHLQMKEKEKAMERLLE
ncbi:MAG: tetratricopeptide repeat protein [Bacteroidota bacterium]